MKSFEAIAREAYDAFKGKVHEGWSHSMPAWAELDQATQEAWMAASRKIAEEIQQVH